MLGQVSKKRLLLRSSLSPNAYWAEQFHKVGLRELSASTSRKEGYIRADEMQGGDNNLAVAVSAYEPKVQCYGTIDPPGLLGSCQNIVDKMDASTTLLTLTTSGANDAAITLPYTLESGGYASNLMRPSRAADILVEDKRCVMIIRTIGGQDTYTWRKFWEVAVALTGMCVRTDRNGIQDRLGESNRCCQVTQQRSKGVYR